jgi:AcrR family transcriptional regulator
MVRNSNGGSSERLVRRAESRRTEILAAAARVFRRRGFSDAGMREIAAEADLSPGNLYHYFRGKDEILYFCQERALDRLLGALKVARRRHGPIGDRLAELIRAHVVCLLEEFEGAIAHLDVESLPAASRADIVARRDRYERGIRVLIEEGVASGEFGPCDAGLVTRAMLGAMNWTARWFRPDGPRTAARVAQELSDYLVRGLGADLAALASPVPHSGIEEKR